MTLPNFKQSQNRVGSTVLKGFLIKLSCSLIRKAVSASCGGSSRWKNRFRLHSGRITILRMVPFWTQHAVLLRQLDHFSFQAKSWNKSNCMASSTSSILVVDKRPYQPPPVRLHQPPRVNPNPKHRTTPMTLWSYSPISTPSRSATLKSMCPIGIWPLSAIGHVKW